MLYSSASAAVTKHPRLDGLDKTNFLILLEAGNPRSWMIDLVDLVPGEKPLSGLKTVPSLLNPQSSQFQDVNSMFSSPSGDFQGLCLRSRSRVLGGH